MKFLLAIAFVALAPAAPALAATPPVLEAVQLEELRAEATVRVVDVRSAGEYATSHIPGAVSAPFAEWLGPADNPGALPPIEQLTKLLRRLGIDGRTHVVVVSSGLDTGSFAAMTRVYWTLKYLGLQRLSVLNGGFRAWQDELLPTDAAVPVIAASRFEPRIDEGVLADKARVAAAIGAAGVRLVDARSPAHFEGVAKAPVARVPGTIAGAVNLDESRWFEPGRAHLPAPAAAWELAAELLGEPAGETITFCNSGQLASVDWFVLSEVLGVPGVRLYAASLAEWTRDAALPMDNVPGRGALILAQIRGVFR